MIRQALHEGWYCMAVTGEGVPSSIRGRKIDARVPGCVHTDLLRAGLIDDPYIGRNEERVQWIGETDWVYECHFDAGPGVLDEERVDLVFGGLDTVATVELNGSRVGETYNMHHPHRFDVRKLLKASGNELRVTFHSAVKYARMMEAKLGTLPWLNTKDPFNFIRKMACNFGWDWGPALTTCGMWRGVRLEGWSRFRIASVVPRSVPTGEQYEVEIAVQLKYANEADVRQARVSAWVLEKISDPIVNYGAADPAAETCVVRIPIENPRIWWPWGHGEQPLYTIELELKDRDPIDMTRDRWSGRIGVRTMELDTSPDDIGRSSS